MKIIITIIRVNYKLILKDLQSEKEIRDVLVNVMDPEIHMNIIELNMVKKVTIDDNNVEVIVALTVAGCPLAETIKKDVKNEIMKLEGINNVNVTTTVMSKEELDEVGVPLSFKWCKCKLATESFGSGVATTPLQLARAYAILGNGGYKIQPFILKNKISSIKK